jgi:hypothetical protein
MDGCHQAAAGAVVVVVEVDDVAAAVVVAHTGSENEDAATGVTAWIW